jgi:hypothetical protein
VSTYYWQIVEVNEADAVTAWPGDIWTFSTQEYALIDGFETYNDDVDAKTTIYRHVDRRLDQRHRLHRRLPQRPVCRAEDRAQRKQSCRWPTTTPRRRFYSEAERTFDTAQDWTSAAPTA